MSKVKRETVISLKESSGNIFLRLREKKKAFETQSESRYKDRESSENHNLSSSVFRHQPHPDTPQKLLITLLFSLVTKRQGGTTTVFPRVPQKHKGQLQNIKGWEKKRSFTDIFFGESFFQEESLAGQRNRTTSQTHK